MEKRRHHQQNTVNNHKIANNKQTEEYFGKTPITSETITHQQCRPEQRRVQRETTSIKIFPTPSLTEKTAQEILVEFQDVLRLPQLRCRTVPIDPVRHQSLLHAMMFQNDVVAVSTKAVDGRGEGLNVHDGPWQPNSWSSHVTTHQNFKDPAVRGYNRDHFEYVLKHWRTSGGRSS
jgi:hypothetical protein